MIQPFAICAILAGLFITANDGMGATYTFDIDGESTGPTVTGLLYGMNVARWDHQFFPTTGTKSIEQGDRVAADRLKNLNPGFLKYPGGNDADSYLWNATDNPAADMDTDEFLVLSDYVGAPGFITVNFRQPPQLAADWLRYIKRASGGRVDVPYWEVGDEVWGPWAKSHVPGAEYGRRFQEFAKALKAVDPNVKLAANLHLSDPDTSWTREALPALGGDFDIITTTFFPLSPPGENDVDLLASPAKYRQLFRRLEAFVSRTVPKRPRPKYCVVGFNSTSTKPGPQTVETANAVFMAQMYGAMAETGTDMACWWAFHNEWKPRGGDYGVVTSDPENRPHYTWFVMKLLSEHFRGKVMAAEQQGDVEFYAVQKDPQSRTLLLINRSDSELADVRVKLDDEGWRTSAADMDVVSSSTLPSGSTRPSQGTAVVMTEDLQFKSLPPYSVSVARLRRD